MLYYLRVTALILYFGLVSGLGIIICLLRPFHPDNTRLFARIFSFGGAWILGIRIRRHNYDSLRKMSPCVYVVNHQDNLDLFVTGRVVAPRTVTVGKKSLRWMPLFGQLYWLAGNVFIDRNNRSRSKAVMSATTEALTMKNTSIWVFAEGTRNRGNNLLPFKRGAFIMAIEAGVPIVPICVSSYAKNIDLHRLKSAEVEINVLSPISTIGLTKDDTDSLLQRCWETMKETIDAMDQASIQVAPQGEYASS